MMRSLERVLRSLGVTQDEIEADARQQLERGQRRPGERIGTGEECGGGVELGKACVRELVVTGGIPQETVIFVS